MGQAITDCTGRDSDWGLAVLYVDFQTMPLLYLVPLPFKAILPELLVPWQKGRYRDKDMSFGSR